MSLTIKTGATLTGGTDVVFNDNGLSGAGERSFASGASTILQPRIIKVKTSIPTTSAANPGSARSEVKFILGSRVEAEACCDVKTGTVMATLSTVWPLNQPATLVDELVEQIRGFVFTTDFVDMIKKARIPN